MKPIAVLLRDGWADWEAGYLLGVAGFFLGTPAKIVTPDATVARSVGGLRASADFSLAELVPQDFSAIAVIGGANWIERDVQIDATVTRLLRSAEASGTPIGAICAGTIALARAGLLDDRAHTSNGVGFLDKNASEYRGVARYRDVPRAVVDKAVVTAPGPAPVTFAVGLLQLAFPGSETPLGDLLALSAREH